MLELAEKIRAMLGSSVQIVFKSLPADDPTQRQPDISRAKEVLGWQPTFALEQGLRSTVAYFDAKLRHDHSTDAAEPNPVLSAKSPNPQRALKL